MKVPRKFKSYLAYPRFQITLVVANLIAVTVLAVTVSGFYSESVKEFYRAGKIAGIDENHPYFGFVTSQLSMFSVHLGLGMVVGGLISALLILVISHKMAGPVVRMKSFFEEIARTGKVKRLKFRGWDITNNLDHTINEALKKIQQG